MRLSLKKLFATQRNLFLTLSSVLLYLLVFVIDLAYLNKSSIPPNVFWTREGLVVLATIFLGITIYRHQFEEEKNIIYKLKTFFFSILGLLLAIAIPKIIFNSDLFATVAVYVPFISRIQESLKDTFFSVFVTLFLIINLFWMLDLIFYKSKRGTQRLFKIAVLLLFIYIVYGHYSHNITEADFIIDGMTTIDWVILGLLLTTIILLSLRTSWVNYLNKRQKVLTFWGGILVLPGIFLFFLKWETLQSIEHYSFTLERFDLPAICFLGNYIVFSEISLVLHLPTESIFDIRMNEIASIQQLIRNIITVLISDEVIATVTALTQDVL